MAMLEKPAKKAQHRLWFNRWLAAMGWTMTIAAGLFIVAVLIERMWVAAEDSGPILAIIAAALAGAALIAAIIFDRFSLIRLPLLFYGDIVTFNHQASFMS